MTGKSDIYACTESTSDLARLAKIIRYHPKFDLGLLKDGNGELANSPERTLVLRYLAIGCPPNKLDRQGKFLDLSGELLIGDEPVLSILCDESFDPKEEGDT